MSDSDRSSPSPAADASAAASDVEQHNREIHENLAHWQRKPELQEEYARFYALIVDRLGVGAEDPVLECGSGIGNLKSVLPQAVSSDLFPNPWLDRQENVYALSCADNSQAGLVLFDVLHHLRYPGTALAEMNRVLKPGGCLVIMEPAAGLLGRIVLGLFHHEPLALKDPITWDAPEDFNPAAVDYYAAQGNAWRIFGREHTNFPWQGWQVADVTYLSAVPWLLTGGFRGPSLNRGVLQPLWRALDRVLQLAPRLFASRMLITLRKETA